MRNVQVRVYNSEGRPQSQIKVVCFIYQFMASGQKEAWTNSDGVAEFNLDVDSGAEISLSVDNGRVQVPRGSIRGDYRVQI
jgi:hypothetical protein